MKSLNKRYLVGCSTGPDSMALLTMCLKHNIYIEVAFVNYRKRKQATLEQKYIKDFCKINKLKLHILDKDYTCKTNFQAFARDYRYNFFKSIILKRKLDAVLIGHNLDDSIETYLMQKAKNIETSYFGLIRTNIINDIKVIRPLLKYEKSYLENYCIKHNVKYFIDESNLKDAYTRNKIRHKCILKLTKQDKLDLVKKIKLLNLDYKHRQQQALTFIKENKLLTVNMFNSYKDKKMLLRSLLYKDISNKLIDDLSLKIKNSKSFNQKVRNKIISLQYNFIDVFDIPNNFLYTIKNIEYKNYKEFKILKTGTNFNGCTVYKDDFPLIIRNARKDDYILMKYGKKHLNRYFIDSKIKLKDRLTFPVVENCKGEIILVKGIGSNINHFSKRNNFFIK